MSTVLAKMMSSASVASLMLAGVMSAHADTMPTQSIVSQQAQQVVQEQDQTQFRNRQRLEKRINGGDSGSTAAVQQRNRHQHRQQRPSGGQYKGQSGNRMQGSGAASSGRRTAGKAGGGGRR